MQLPAVRKRPSHPLLLFTLRPRPPCYGIQPLILMPFMIANCSPRALHGFSHTTLGPHNSAHFMFLCPMKRGKKKICKAKLVLLKFKNHYYRAVSVTLPNFNMLLIHSIPTIHVGMRRSLSSPPEQFTLPWCFVFQKSDSKIQKIQLWG